MIDFMIILGIILIILLIITISKKCKKKEEFVVSVKGNDISQELLSTSFENGKDYYIQVRHKDSDRVNLLPNSGGWNEINGKMYPLIGAKIDIAESDNIFKKVKIKNAKGGSNTSGQPCTQHTIEKSFFYDDDVVNKPYKNYSKEQIELMKKRLGEKTDNFFGGAFGNYLSVQVLNKEGSNISCGHQDKTIAQMKQLCLKDDKCTSFSTKNNKPHCLKHHEVLTFPENAWPGHKCYKKNRKNLNQLIHFRQRDAIINAKNVKMVNFTDITDNYNYTNVPSITWDGYGVTYYFIKNENLDTYIIKARYTGYDKSQYIFKHEKYTDVEKKLEIKDTNITSHTYFEPDNKSFETTNNYSVNFNIIITKINPEIIDFITNNKDNKVSIDTSKLKIIEFDTAPVTPYNGDSIFNINKTFIYTLIIDGNANKVCFIKEEDKYAIIKLDDEIIKSGSKGNELQYLHKTHKTDKIFKPFVFGDDITILDNDNNLFTLKYNDNDNKIKDLINKNLTPPFFNRTDYGLKEGESYIINIGVNIKGFTNIDGQGYYRLYKIPKLDDKEYKFVTDKLKNGHSLYYLKEHEKEIYHPIGLLKDGNKYIIYDFSQLKLKKLKYLTENGFKEFVDYNIDSSYEKIPTFNLSYVEMTGTHFKQLYIIGKNIKINDSLQTKCKKYISLFKTLYPDKAPYEISNNPSNEDMEEEVNTNTYLKLYNEIKNKKTKSTLEKNTNTIMLYIYIRFFKSYDGIKKLYISKHIDLFKNDYYNLIKKNPYILVKNTTNLNHFEFDKIGENKLKGILLKNTNYNCHKNPSSTYCFYTLDKNYNYNFLDYNLSSTKTKKDFDIKVIETTAIQYGILKTFKEQEITNNVGITIKRGGYYLRLIDNSFDFTDCMNVNDKKPLKVSKEENANMDSKYVIKSDNQIWKNDDDQVYYFLNKQIYTIINYIPKVQDLIIEYKPNIVSKSDVNCATVVQYEDKSISMNSSDDMEGFTNPKHKNIQFLLKNKNNSKYLTYTIKNEETEIKKVETKELKTKTYYTDGIFQKSQSSIFYIGDNGDTFCYLSKIENLENRKINLGDIKPIQPKHTIQDYKNIINTKRIKHTIGKLIGDNEVGYTIRMDDIKNVDGVFELVPLDGTFNLEEKELKLYKTEQTKIINIDNKLDKTIKQLKITITTLNNNINQIIQNINNKLIKIDKLLTKYEVHAKKNINQKLKDILVVIYNNYQIDLDIILLRQSYQAKVQFSVVLSTDEEYVQILKNEINDAKFEIKRLELQIKEKNLINYFNLQETNQIIGKVNDMIDIIQEKLDSLETKENFNKFNYHNKEHKRFNKIYNNISGKINIININIINNNTLYDNKIKLEENLKNLEAYDKLLKTKTDSLETNYRNMFSKFDQDLYNLKNKLYSKNTNKEERFKVLQRKFNIDNLQIAKINFNHIERDSLELELMDLQDKIKSLNLNIKEVNLINRADKQLRELKNINLHIIKYRLMNTRAYEGFQNGSINSVKDIINRNDFGLSKSNEDNLTDFRSTQSLYNNENISIQPIQEDNTFKIHINNKCLEVKGDKNYSLSECNKVTPKQYFEAIKIKNKTDAIETNKVLPSNEKIKYPFYQMVSSISGNCLSLDDNGVSVVPCNTNSIQQHWKMKKHEKLCLDN